MPPVLYTAPVVCPMTGPPLADAGVLVADGAVLDVGPAAPLWGQAARVHEIDGVLLPGLVNGHTHLELLPGTAHIGVTAVLRGGSVAVGDVVRHGPAVPAAARAGLHGDSWVEVADVDVIHHDGVLAAVERALALPAGSRRVGIAPVATSVGTGVLQALASLARRARVPLHLHLAQSQAEVVALATGRGPLADRARASGLELEWLEGGTGLSPVRYAEACGVLGPGTTVARGVWVDADEAALLAATSTTVVCCPRADARQGSGQLPLERYAEARAPLALGTESPTGAACDLLAEAATWADLARRRGLRAWPGGAEPLPLAEKAVRLLTVDGAAAMGWRGLGTLAAGGPADLVGVAVPATPDTVYDELLGRGRGRQLLTVVGGVARSRRLDADVPWQVLDPDAAA